MIPHGSDDSMYVGLGPFFSSNHFIWYHPITANLGAWTPHERTVKQCYGNHAPLHLMPSQEPYSRNQPLFLAARDPDETGVMHAKLR